MYLINLAVATSNGSRLMGSLEVVFLTRRYAANVLQSIFKIGVHSLPWAIIPRATPLAAILQRQDDLARQVFPPFITTQRRR